MGATMEALPGRLPGLKSTTLRKPLGLRTRDSRLLVEPDGSVRSFESLSERRSLFGFEHLRLFKVQAGILVQAQRPDWGVRAAPRSVQFAGRVFDNIEVLHTIDFFRSSYPGYVRKVKVRNSGTAAVKLRMVGIFDPAAAQLGESQGRWGSLALNAFNRDSHIAMDEVSDPPSARVVGAVPSPTKFYMTTDRSRAQDLFASGELPEATAGMSGQVIILSQHDISLSPGESMEVRFVCLYNPERLEDALSDFGRLQGSEAPAPKTRPLFACSSPVLTEAVSWAVVAVEGAGFSKDPLDRYESATALAMVQPQAARSIFDNAKAAMMKDGSVPHSLDPARAGVLETAVLLQALCRHLWLAQDKKLSRSLYPVVRKLAGSLILASKGYSVRPAPVLPQGWRRFLGRGFPTGEIPEVSLAAAGGLAGASQVARQLAKSDEAGKFRERSEMILEGVRKRLVDERGFLYLCVDSAGRPRNDETIDMAVASFRHPFHQSAEQAAAHRLLEKDFETPYGPRCVPRSNQFYFNGSYGKGQLGGYWTRAALAHAALCYRVGLAGIGSLGLQKVAQLVAEDAPKLGGSPGEFPYWVDVEAGEAHGEDTDPVAAARFVECLVHGELGLGHSTNGVVLSPPASSGLAWVMAADFWAGEQVSAFVGRSGGRVHTFLGATRAQCREATRFAKSDVLETSGKGVFGVSFHGPGQVICLGNSTTSSVRVNVPFSPRAAELSKRLSTPLEAYDPVGGSWAKVASIRVFPTMSFEASLGPGEWKAFRVST